MPLIPPGYAEVWVRMELTGDPEPMYTSIGVATTDPAGLPVADALLNFFGGGIETIISSSYTITGGHVYFGNDGAPTRIDGTPQARVGDGSADALTQNTALLVQKRTAVSGRSGRGRMYIPGVPEGACNSAGVLQTTYRNSVNSVLAAWLVGDVNVDGLALLHDADPPTDIITLSVAPVVATQRRRLRR